MLYLYDKNPRVACLLYRTPHEVLYYNSIIFCAMNSIHGIVAIEMSEVVPTPHQIVF